MNTYIYIYIFIHIFMYVYIHIYIYNLQGLCGRGNTHRPCRVRSVITVINHAKPQTLRLPVGRCGEGGGGGWVITPPHNSQT